MRRRQEACDVCEDPAVGLVEIRLTLKRWRWLDRITRPTWKLHLCGRCGGSVSHVLQGVRAELGADRATRRRRSRDLARDLVRQVG